MDYAGHLKLDAIPQRWFHALESLRLHVSESVIPESREESQQIRRRFFDTLGARLTMAIAGSVATVLLAFKEK
jgi:hypothetical protein